MEINILSKSEKFLLQAHVIFSHRTTLVQFAGGENVLGSLEPETVVFVVMNRILLRTTASLHNNYT